LQFHAITPADKAAVENCLQGQIYENSEVTFANMYLWREGWGLQLAPSEGALFLLAQHDGRLQMCQPLVPLGQSAAAAADAALHYLRQHGAEEKIVCVNEQFCARVLAETDAFVAEEDRDMDEYIYSVPDLITLGGKKYHAKRNHVNRFMQNVEHTWQNLGAENGAECLALFDAWAAQRENSADIIAERQAIAQAFENFDLLQLIAGGIRVNGALRGFAVAGMINPDLAVIHFEKADAEIPGIYAALNRQFLQRCLPEVPFVNRQEDMGLPGLRKAKLSYYPCRFAKKYVLWRHPC